MTIRTESLVFSGIQGVYQQIFSKLLPADHAVFVPTA
jgi:hypothetical protein